MQGIRILVVDDFAPWRATVCSILSRRGDLLVVGEASDGLQAIQRAEELRPDLIILDIGMPGLNGIEAAKRINISLPESRILFVSEECSEDIVREALNAGAAGYVVKTAADSELLDAVEAVLQGGRFMSKQVEP